MADYIICIISVFGLHNTYLKDESGGSLFMTVRRRVRRPFFPSHTRLLSVLTRASTSGILAFMEMALSSFNSWLFRRRYLFLKDREHIEKVNQHLIFHLRLKVKNKKKYKKNAAYSWWSLKLWSNRKNWILKDISCVTGIKSVHPPYFKKWYVIVMMSLGLLNWNFILDYSHSSHSGHAQRDSKLYISSRWACRTGCWALGWDETQPASCEPERSYRGGKNNLTLFRQKNSSSALMVGKSTWFLWRPIRRTQSTYSTSTLYIISWTIFMDWGSRCLRGLVARELSSDDSVGEERKTTTEKHVQMYY